MKRTFPMTSTCLAALLFWGALFCGHDRLHAHPIPLLSAQEESTALHLPARKGDLHIFYLSKPEGVLNRNPCNPSGGSGLFGILRTLVRERKKVDSLFFITGDLFPHKERSNDPLLAARDALSMSLLPDLYKEMKATAVLPGVGDLMGGVERFRDLARSSGLRPVCSNLVRKSDGTPVFEGRFVLEVNGIRVGIMGVLNPFTFRIEKEGTEKSGMAGKRKQVSVTDFIPEKDLEVLDPITCALRTAEALHKDGADMILALSCLTLRKSRDLLKDTPVDIVLGNNLCRKNNYRLRPDGVRASTKSGARALGCLEMHFSGDPEAPMGDRGRLEEAREERKAVEGEYRALVERYGTEDPEALGRLAAGTEDGERFLNLRRKKDDLEAEIVLLRAECEANSLRNRFIEGNGFVTEGPEATGTLWQRYVEGTRSLPAAHEAEVKAYLSDKHNPDIFVTNPEDCRSCHEAQYDRWKSTPHASAFSVVNRMGLSFDPECIQCHSTGYRVSRGFDLPPPPEGFQGVNCEACHGFVGIHLKDFIDPPQGRLKGQERTKLVKLCTTCHKEERSPDFNKSFPDKLKAVACPAIDFSRPRLRALYEAREEAAMKRLDEKGRLENADAYVRAAIYKKRLGRPNGEILDLLYQGFAVDHNDIDLVRFLYNTLLEERRPKDAVDVMETYLADNTMDREVNLEVIRLLTLSPQPDARDPKRAREYITWYLSNLGRGDIEVYLLLAAADLQIGGEPFLEEARQALNEAETKKPAPEDREKIKMLREQLKRMTGGGGR